jgi:hypothetical protein
MSDTKATFMRLVNSSGMTPGEKAEQVMVFNKLKTDEEKKKALSELQRGTPRDKSYQTKVFGGPHTK